MAEYLIREETLVEMADSIRKKEEQKENIIALISARKNYTPTALLGNITLIGDHAFNSCTNLALTSLPEGVTSIGNSAFNACRNLNTITFKGTPTSIALNAFRDCTNLTTINVPWSEGEVANAPWGATKATINYNYTGE